MNTGSLHFREANSPKNWDHLWGLEGLQSWRGTALKDVYERIEQLIPAKARVTDIGGGLGILAHHLENKVGRIRIWDISPLAIENVRRYGFEGTVVDLEEGLPLDAPSAGEVVIATEVLEHLSVEARARILEYAAKADKAFFSVPNWRLGPEEEPQHTIKFSAIEFLRLLRQYFKHVRVEVLGGPASEHGEPSFLLAVCGFEKKTTLSVTLPVRDEEADIGKTLASFRGAADEMVIGVDPRSKDKTFEIAARYAESVFYFEDPEGPLPGQDYEGPRCKELSGEKRVPDGGVHFSWVRNQCLDACSKDWIFMTEGHERLVGGTDCLLHLHQLPEGAKVALVWRSDLGGQRWGFPWLTKNNPKILYRRATHNSLDFPDSFMAVRLPQIRTLHDRVHARSAERAAQRKIQNRITLLDDWMTRGSEYSKYYLASEWREFDTDKSEQHFRDLLNMKSKQGDMRYQARLILAKLLAVRGATAEAREVLLKCTEDDWQRTEHWVWLGDLAFQQNKFEEALQFYQYSTVRLGEPPFTTWWIESSFYSYLPAQRMAMTYGELGNAERALFWAKQVLALLPPEAPKELSDEALSNISLLEEALNGTAQ